MLLSVSRLMFAWASDSIFPQVTARVHPVFHTPLVALITSGVVASLGILGSHFAGDFFLGVDIMVTSMLVNFLLMCITLGVIHKKNQILADKMTLFRSQPIMRTIVSVVGIIFLLLFLVIHISKDMNSNTVWYFKSTPVWLFVMLTGTVIYREKFGKSREAQFLTKWVPEPGPCTRLTVRTAMEKFLDRMKTDSIDLLQFHAWNYADPSWLDSMFWLQELKQEGLIKNLGVTNFDAPHLRIALTSGIEVISNQICYSVLDQRAAHEMSSVCAEFQVQILAFGTLAGGFISEKWLNQPEPPKLDTWSQMKYKRFIEVSGGWTKFQNYLFLIKLLRNMEKAGSFQELSGRTWQGSAVR